MDAPDLPAEAHVRALRGLARINRISRSDAALWPPIRALADAMPDQPVRVLDVATGGGDVPVRVLRRARASGIALDVHVCDISPTAVELSRRKASEQGLVLHGSVVDVVREPLPGGFDAVTCSLFLHHLDDRDALALLQEMGAAASRLVLVSDLRRSRLGYAVAWAGTRLLSRSPIVHADGPLSVQAAFTPAELQALAERAGLSDARVERRWPWRMLLCWWKPRANAGGVRAPDAAW